MQSIPLQSVPNQSLTVNLNGQLCVIQLQSLEFQNAPDFLLNYSILGEATLGSLYPKPPSKLFCTMSIAGNIILQTRICLDRRMLVRAPYLGFLGDIGFMDTQGTDDPIYTGLGSRFQLIYFLPDEL